MIAKKIPFTFGTITLDFDFVNRKSDIERLRQHFASGINTIIISPRRWGKSSLVERVASSFEKDKDVKVCTLDLFSVRSEEEFYIALANVVLKETATKWEEFVANTKAFLAQLLPQISLGANDENTLKFGISWKDLKKNPEDILNLAERIAQKKQQQIVICIDEFQNIATFSDSLSFQKKLRAVIQKHQNVTYCFYGSKRHMLMEVFSDVSMPFYKFGEILFLQKIATAEWVSFIQKRFKETGKEISENLAQQIVLLADNHSYYVQQLAQQVWFRTEKKCTDNTVTEAHKGLVQQLSLLFVTLTENLSNTQINYLKALLNGEKQMTSKEVLEKYRLGTSANAVRLRRTLINNEVLDSIGKELSFQDPMYRHWLISDFFKIK